MDIFLINLIISCIFISIRGIYTIFESVKVSQTKATRSRHVSRSDSVVFNSFVLFCFVLFVYLLITC